MHDGVRGSWGAAQGVRAAGPCLCFPSPFAKGRAEHDASQAASPCFFLRPSTPQNHCYCHVRHDNGIFSFASYHHAYTASSCQRVPREHLSGSMTSLDPLQPASAHQALQPKALTHITLPEMPARRRSTCFATTHPSSSASGPSLSGLTRCARRKRLVVSHGLIHHLPFLKHSSPSLSLCGESFVPAIVLAPLPCVGQPILAIFFSTSPHQCRHRSALEQPSDHS